MKIKGCLPPSFSLFIKCFIKKKDLVPVSPTVQKVHDRENIDVEFATEYYISLQAPKVKFFRCMT